MAAAPQVNPNVQTVPAPQEADTRTLAQALPGLSDLPVAADGENGFALFNLDWQNRRAEMSRLDMSVAFARGRETLPTSPQQQQSTLNDLIPVALGHDDFEVFRDQPNAFWQQVQQISQRTETGSRYERFLNEMQSSRLPLGEFVKTLPPGERQVFMARTQLDRTFGPGIFGEDGVTLSREGQAQVLAFRDALRMSPPSNPVPESAGKTAESPVPQRATLPTVSPRPAVPEIKTPIIETSPARVSSNAGSEGSPAVPFSISRRENGAAMCAALVNGTFASIEEHRNADGLSVGWRPARVDTFDDRVAGFSAGATGSLFGAAVGEVLPKNGDDAGGVLGFISGVVAGVDVDRGFRWLAAGGRQLNAAEGF